MITNHSKLGSDPIEGILRAAFEAKVSPSLPVPDLGSFHRNFNAPRRLAEGAETFARLFAPSGLLGLGYVAIHDNTKDNVLGRGLSPTFLTPKHLAQLGELETDSITLNGDTPPLARFVESTQYRDARLILVKDGVASGTATFASPLARFQRPNGDEIPHNQLSFGEKRLLAFLLELHANPHTIIVDELANGMHHSWLDACVELLEEFETQAFLTSQNPLLLDSIPLSRETFASAHTLVVCELDDESGQMVWRNLSEAETEDFFRSYDVGLQHISEIMRDKGLW